MAEFCLECWNKINETNDPARWYVLSRELDFCEECNQWKPVIIRARRFYAWKLALTDLIQETRNR